MCSEFKYIDTLLKLKSSKAKGLQNIISFDKITEEKSELCKQADIKLYYFYDIIEDGKKAHDVVVNEPKPDSVYMFSYTSGTTGDPKGVIITHKSFLSCGNCLSAFNMNFGEGDVSLSYLPLGHTME